MTDLPYAPADEPRDLPIGGVFAVLALVTFAIVLSLLLWVG